MRTGILVCVFAAIGMIHPAASIAAPAPERAGVVGVATVDITPETPVRMYGYASRKTESEGVAGRLSASALAIGGDSERAPAILLSVENGSVPPAMRAAVLQRLRAKIPLKDEQFMLCNTHIHSGPDLEGMDSLSGEQREHMKQYASMLTDRLEQVCFAAVAARRPGHLSWAQGKVAFAANRRVLKEGKWSGFGAVADAPADHTLPILRVTDAEGRLMAVLVNYACHSTTLRPNFRQIHGDWGACAREAIQAEFPGVVAMTALGCGADADPAPHGTVELAEQHGRAIAYEVKRLLSGPLEPVAPAVTARTVSLEIPFDPPPPMEELRKFAEKTYSAAQTLKLLESGQKAPTFKRYDISAWSFGDDLAMVFLPNEVVVDYALRLRRELDGSRLWINAYSNEVLYYVVSKRLIAEGGYEVNNSLSALVTYGRTERDPAVEDRIIEGIRSIVPEQFRSGTTTAAP